MQKQRINFATSPSGVHRTGLLILIIGLIASAYVTSQWFKTHSQLISIRETIASVQAETHHQPTVPVVEPRLSGEIKAAHEIASQLNLPWPTLFHTLESTQSPDVQLLAIDPDTGTGNILITGQAEDLNKVFTYMSGLGKSGFLSNTRLRDYQKTMINGKPSVRFTLSADWLKHAA